MDNETELKQNLDNNPALQHKNVFPTSFAEIAKNLEKMASVRWMFEIEFMDKTKVRFPMDLSQTFKSHEAITKMLKGRADMQKKPIRFIEVISATKVTAKLELIEAELDITALPL